MGCISGKGSPRPPVAIGCIPDVGGRSSPGSSTKRAEIVREPGVAEGVHEQKGPISYANPGSQRGFTNKKGRFRTRTRGGDGAGGDGAGGDGTRATLGNVRGGTVSGANGGVERSETVPVPELPRSRHEAPRRRKAPAPKAPGKRAAPEKRAAPGKGASTKSAVRGNRGKGKREKGKGRGAPSAATKKNGAESDDLVPFVFGRRDRDSNPRYPFGVHTISNRASSATRASLQKSAANIALFFRIPIFPDINCS